MKLAWHLAPWPLLAYPFSFSSLHSLPVRVFFFSLVLRPCKFYIQLHYEYTLQN